MTNVPSINLRLIAMQKAASKNYSRNLAGLKKFTEGQLPQIISKQRTAQTELMGSLEKLAQAAQSIQRNTGL